MDVKVWIDFDDIQVKKDSKRHKFLTQLWTISNGSQMLHFFTNETIIDRESFILFQIRNNWAIFINRYNYNIRAGLQSIIQ